MSTVEHRFPVGNKRWSVDLAAAARSAGIAVERLTREANDMAQHLPRWLLVLVREGQPALCKCGGLFVFDQNGAPLRGAARAGEAGTCRGARCVLCENREAPRNARAGWFGVLPPIGLDGLAKIKDAIVAKPPKRHVVGRQDPIGTYVLVPMVVQYPGGYPNHPVDVYYLPEFRDIPGMPRDEYSHAFHMIGAGRMCLFAGNEWREEMLPREVLQQRAYPHAIKFLNYANGKRDAFAIVTR